MRNSWPIACVFAIAAVACGPNSYSEEKADSVFAEQVEPISLAQAERYRLDFNSVQGCVVDDFQARELADKRIILTQMADDADGGFPTWAEIALVGCWELSDGSVWDFDEALAAMDLVRDPNNTGIFVHALTNTRVGAAGSPTSSVASVAFGLEQDQDRLGMEVEVVETALLKLSLPRAEETARSLAEAVAARKSTTVGDEYRVCFEPLPSVDMVVLGNINFACASE